MVGARGVDLAGGSSSDEHFIFSPRSLPSTMSTSMNSSELQDLMNMGRRVAAVVKKCDDESRWKGEYNRYKDMTRECDARKTFIFYSFFYGLCGWHAFWKGSNSSPYLYVCGCLPACRHGVTSNVQRSLKSRGCSNWTTQILKCACLLLHRFLCCSR